MLYVQVFIKGNQVIWSKRYSLLTYNVSTEHNSGDLLPATKLVETLFIVDCYICLYQRSRRCILSVALSTMQLLTIFRRWSTLRTRDSNALISIRIDSGHCILTLQPQVTSKNVLPHSLTTKFANPGFPNWGWITWSSCPSEKMENRVSVCRSIFDRGWFAKDLQVAMLPGELGEGICFAALSRILCSALFSICMPVCIMYASLHLPVPADYLTCFWFVWLCACACHSRRMTITRNPTGSYQKLNLEGNSG